MGAFHLFHVICCLFTLEISASVSQSTDFFQVLESFFHRHVMVRHAALHTVFLTLQQGLVHPVQCVPYLVAASSDQEPLVHKEADQQVRPPQDLAI